MGTTLGDEPEKKQLPPLRPEIGNWVGLEINSKGLNLRLFGFDTAQLMVFFACPAIMFSVWRNADWKAYSSILVVALATLLASKKGGGEDGSNGIESNKDPPKPGGVHDGT